MGKTQQRQSCRGTRWWPSSYRSHAFGAIDSNHATRSVENGGNVLATYKWHTKTCVMCGSHVDLTKTEAFSRSDAGPQAEGPSLALGGSGEVPTPKDASDVFSVVGESEHSDASSRSAKCFLPNTALHGVDGHLLRVEKLKIGDRVRLLDHSEAAVVGMHLHRAKKKPYGLVELTTRQGLSTVSKSHRVAVPAGESEGARIRLNDFSTFTRSLLNGPFDFTCNLFHPRYFHLQPVSPAVIWGFHSDMGLLYVYKLAYALVGPSTFWDFP